MSATQEIGEMLRAEPPGIRLIGAFIGKYLDTLNDLGDLPSHFAITGCLNDQGAPIGVFVQPDESISIISSEVAIRVLQQGQCVDEFVEDRHHDVAENLRVAVAAGSTVIAFVSSGAKENGRYAIFGLDYSGREWGRA